MALMFLAYSSDLELCFVDNVSNSFLVSLFVCLFVLVFFFHCRFLFLC